MNKEDFTRYLEDTSLLDLRSISSLNELISEFPYFQSARILLTLNLFVERNIRFDSELKTTAIYVSNRGLLRKYIDKLNNDEVIYKEKLKSKEEKTSKEINDQQEVPKPNPKADDKIENPEVGIEDELESIAEVKSILERHIRELEFENNRKKEESITNKNSTKSVKQKSDIIDDFIKNEPSISRPKTKFYDPVEKAKESIVDTENIVSETLAGIFYDQGHLIKAIKIYQKLSLKFPEKSSYFAALIKKAEKELES